MTLAPFGALRIIVSEHALETTAERLFPVSKNRSRRIHKKLVKRFGGEFRRVPAVFMTPMGIVCHPTMFDRIKRELAALERRTIDQTLNRFGPSL